MRQEMAIDRETAGDWATVLQKLIKGKTKMDREVRGIVLNRGWEWDD
jgi:hypothetical protein